MGISFNHENETNQQACNKDLKLVSEYILFQYVDCECKSGPKNRFGPRNLSIIVMLQAENVEQKGYTASPQSSDSHNSGHFHLVV